MKRKLLPRTAIITHIRREGGERTDIKPGRFIYNISYTFTLPDGKEINGLAKQLGDGIYQKADGTSTVQIIYLPGFPYFNALERMLKWVPVFLKMFPTWNLIVLLVIYRALAISVLDMP